MKATQPQPAVDYTAFIDRVNDLDRKLFSRHCHFVHGEAWEHEWKLRITERASAAAAS